MIAFVLWLYGLLVISSVIMIIAWGTAARQISHRHPWHVLPWCKAWVIAAGLTVHATAMAAACGYRAWDILANGILPMGSDARVQVVLLLGLGLSKMMFVWAGSITEQPPAVRWPWWAFLYVLMLWGLYCLVFSGAPR